MSKERSNPRHEGKTVDSTGQYFSEIQSYPLLTHEQEIFYSQGIERGRIAKTILHLVYPEHAVAKNLIPLVGQEHSALILETSASEFLKKLAIQDDVEIVTSKRLVKVNKLDENGKLVNEEKTIAEGLKVKDQISLKTKLNPQALEQMILEAEESKQHFIVSNLRLVATIAKKYAGPKNDLLDLIQDGNTGLIFAVSHFGWSTGFKFSTFATWWINQAITRGIKDKGSLIRVPVHASDDLTKIETQRSKLQQKLGRNPTIEELAEAVGMPEEKVNQLIKLTTTARNVSSIDVALDGEETEHTLADFLEDSGENPETQAIEGITKMDIRAAIEKMLEKREFRVLELRFGLTEDERERTLQEVAREFGVTRERIRQIEAKALEKLKGDKRLEQLL